MSSTSWHFQFPPHRTEVSGEEEDCTICTSKKGMLTQTSVTEAVRSREEKVSRKTARGEQEARQCGGVALDSCLCS